MANERSNDSDELHDIIDQKLTALIREMEDADWSAEEVAFAIRDVLKSKWLYVAAMKAEAVIPSKRNRKIFIPHDIDVYRHRNRIERCFNCLKHFRRFATRYDRQTVHFEGFVHLAAAMIWLR